MAKPPTRRGADAAGGRHGRRSRSPRCSSSRMVAGGAGDRAAARRVRRRGPRRDRQDLRKDLRELGRGGRRDPLRADRHPHLRLVPGRDRRRRRGLRLRVLAGVRHGHGPAGSPRACSPTRSAAPRRARCCTGSSARQRFDRLERAVEHGGVTLLLAARLVPIVPFSLFSYVAGAAACPSAASPGPPRSATSRSPRVSVYLGTPPRGALAGRPADLARGRWRSSALLLLTRLLRPLIDTSPDSEPEHDSRASPAGPRPARSPARTSSSEGALVQRLRRRRAR